MAASRTPMTRPLRFGFDRDRWMPEAERVLARPLAWLIMTAAFMLGVAGAWIPVGGSPIETIIGLAVPHALQSVRAQEIVLGVSVAVLLVGMAVAVFVARHRGGAPPAVGPALGAFALAELAVHFTGQFLIVALRTDPLASLRVMANISGWRSILLYGAVLVGALFGDAVASAMNKESEEEALATSWLYMALWIAVLPSATKLVSTMIDDLLRGIVALWNPALENGFAWLPGIGARIVVSTLVTMVLIYAVVRLCVIWFGAPRSVWVGYAASAGGFALALFVDWIAISVRTGVDLVTVGLVVTVVLVPLLDTLAAMIGVPSLPDLTAHDASPKARASRGEE